jgi:calcium/calmodulin-dependent protein kinase I
MDSAFFKTTPIKDFYKFDKILGEYIHIIINKKFSIKFWTNNRGSFAVVRKAYRKSDNKEFAIKIIDK